MSAVSNLTYVWFYDSATSVPLNGGGPIVFSNYDEAMSYAKFISVTYYATSGFVTVWNYNGESGHWANGTFAPRANTNWP